MIISKKVIAILCFIVMFFFWGQSSVFADKITNDKIRVGFFESPGLNDIGKDGRHKGYVQDYLRLISKYTDWEYEFVHGTWPECMQMLESGDIDLLPAMQKTPERENMFYFPDLEMGESSAIILVKTNNQKYRYDDFENFNGIKIGLIKNNVRNEELIAYAKEKGFTCNLKYYEKESLLMEAMQSGEVDAYTMSDIRKREGVRVIAKFNSNPFYIAVTKHRKDLLVQLNKAMTSIKLLTPFVDAMLFNRYFHSTERENIIFTDDEIKFIQSSKPIRVVYTLDAPPLNMFDNKTKNIDGIMKEIFDIISEQTGLKFEYYACSSRELMVTSANRGSADVILEIVSSPVIRKRYHLKMSNPVLSIPLVKIVPRTAISETPIKKIAFLKWNVTVEDFAYKSADVAKVYYKTVKDCLDAIINNEVGAAYMNAYSASYLLNDRKYRDLIANHVGSITQNISIAFPEMGSPELFSIINKALMSIPLRDIDTIVNRNIAKKTASIYDILYDYPFLIIGVAFVLLLIIIVFIMLITKMRIKANKKIFEMSNIDELTGLWNMNRFKVEGDNLLKRDDKTDYALVIISVANIEVNYSIYDLQKREDMIKNIAKYYSSHISEGEMLARQDNDVFVMILKYANKVEFNNRILSFQEDLKQFFHNDDFQDLNFVLNSGIYIINSYDTDIVKLISNTFFAKNYSNIYGNSNYRYFDDILNVKIESDFQLKKDALESIKSGAFLTYFQPQFDITTKEIVGAEALVRWDHPDYGLLPPARFIPLFETCDIMPKIDLLIFENACKFIRAVQDRNDRQVRVAINFSGYDLSDASLPDALLAITKKYNVPTNALCVEISCVLPQYESLSANSIAKLRDMGFFVYVKIFLNNNEPSGVPDIFNLNYIKFNRTILMKCGNNKFYNDIIKSIVDLAKKNDILVIGESIESKDYENLVKDIGCEVVQGFLYAKPMPEAEFANILGKQNKI